MTFFEWFYKAVIIQGICVLLILLSIFIIKYFFKFEFEKVSKVYQKYITTDTDVNEVLSDEV